MGQERTVRVVAPGTGDDGQARPLVDAGLDLGQELKGHVRQDDDGLESFNLAEVLLIFGHEAAQGDIRPQADLGESVVDVGAVFPNEGESEGRAVFGQELAVAVLQKAARRVNALGAQMVGGEGIKERADFLSMMTRTGITVDEIANMENVYSPAIGALNEPIAVAAQNLLKEL